MGEGLRVGTNVTYTDIPSAIIPCSSMRQVVAGGRPRLFARIRRAALSPAGPFSASRDPSTGACRAHSTEPVGPGPRGIHGFDCTSLG